MKRNFISKDSQEVWSIELEENILTITSGNPGGEGQISQTFLESTKYSKGYVEMLVRDKIQNGYSESTIENELKIVKKKYSLEYGGTAEELAKIILNDEILPQLRHLSIGNWGDAWECTPDVISKMIIDNKEKFIHLESLYIGDMDSEECEVSWIQHGDYSEVLKTLTNLRSFKMKGVPGNLGDNIDMPQLEEIEVIAGGLPLQIATQLKNAKLPNLKKLVLYMGVDNYGLDCSVDDLKVLASKDLFPNLKHLGFADSEEQNQILAMVLESDILPQLEILDISCGCFTDEGGQLILDNEAKLSHLKLLDISYHFLTEGMMEKLSSLPLEIDLSDAQDPDDEYMYPLITE